MKILKRMARSCLTQSLPVHTSLNVKSLPARSRRKPPFRPERINRSIVQLQDQFAGLLHSLVPHPRKKTRRESVVMSRQELKRC